MLRCSQGWEPFSKKFKSIFHNCWPCHQGNCKASRKYQIILCALLALGKQYCVLSFGKLVIDCRRMFLIIWNGKLSIFYILSFKTHHSHILDVSEQALSYQKCIHLLSPTSIKNGSASVGESYHRQWSQPGKHLWDTSLFFFPSVQRAMTSLIPHWSSISQQGWAFKPHLIYNNCYNLLSIYHHSRVFANISFKSQDNPNYTPHFVYGSWSLEMLAHGHTARLLQSVDFLIWHLLPPFRLSKPVRLMVI